MLDPTLTECLIAIAVYAVCTIAFLPGLALTLAFGGLFGGSIGGGLSLIGATLGSSAAIWLTRRLTKNSTLSGAPLASQKIKPNFFQRRWSACQPAVIKLNQLVDRYGVRTVIITRLTPIVPFNLLNYLLGLTRLPNWQITGLSFLCMAPACFAYAWLGATGFDALVERDVRHLLYALIALALVVLLKPLSSWLIRRWTDG